MNKNIYLYSGILGLLASVICGFFNWCISSGIIIGLLSSYLYFYLLNMQFQFKDGEIKKGGILGFGIRIIVLALPLLIACLLPNYFNIFGAFGGVMVFRIIMMIMFFKQKGEM
ncbi:MAG: ATP synthase subunit I [Firmicutes bacterium]|nr:ATP synthase subunit I [Candidatus Colivicinus equi]